MTNLHERMLPDVRIEPAIVRIPGGRASDRATVPSILTFHLSTYLFNEIMEWDNWNATQRGPKSRLNEHTPVQPQNEPAHVKWIIITKGKQRRPVWSEPQRRLRHICRVSPESSLFAHIIYGARGSAKLSHEIVQINMKTWAWQNHQHGLCAQRRLRSAWASAQSDWSLRCPQEERLGPKLPIKHWAHSSFRWFCHAAAHMKTSTYPSECYFMCLPYHIVRAL